MKEKSIKIQLSGGLDARPVAMLVQVASQHESSVYIETEGKNQVLRSLKEGEDVERSARQLRALVIALGYQSRWPEE